MNLKLIISTSIVMTITHIIALFAFISIYAGVAIGLFYLIGAGAYAFITVKSLIKLAEYWSVKL